MRENTSRVLRKGPGAPAAVASNLAGMTSCALRLMKPSGCRSARGKVLAKAPQQRTAAQSQLPVLSCSDLSLTVDDAPNRPVNGASVECSSIRTRPRSM